MSLSELCKSKGMTVRELSKITLRPESTLYYWWSTGQQEKVYQLIKLAKGKAS